ncbi:glycosyltransferase family 2 protein [Bifidobacterium eulemuris]|uniref:Glycosyltransferase family 2 protein n=1 Tax=Bifidobacterium eulemuris TaxID=1765219 RepID=A0A261GC24_9BIFI|nr:glycosyltransferase family 2 protein [Bifidobacterium eulemuris]OZG68978.1 hypothetical protein BEUL_0384 [Bifidobacterium eulemuris]QOL31488.1 glycosyltransferase family 2 protein [Bifidobacterium eulemuris]
MNPTGNSDIQQALADAMASRPYTHRQDVDASVAAVITVEEDTRFLTSTLCALLTQTILPGVIVVADTTGATAQPIQASFEVIPSPAGPALEIPESKHVTIRVVRAKGARSFADAVAKALQHARLDSSIKALWLLHDDSRPADDQCLENLLEAWHNAPGASVLGAKQLDWEAERLHDVGSYVGRHTVESLVVEGEPDQEQYDGRQDVFAVSLAGALVSMEQYRALEGVNPWFTTFGESRDFCRRVCLSGGRVVVVPQARIAHRRARYEGVRSRDGEPLAAERGTNAALSVRRAAQRYRYTDVPKANWIWMWLWSVLRGLGLAVACLFGKKPWEAWCELCLPWLALTSIPGARRARRMVARQTKVSMSNLRMLTIDKEQRKLWHDRKQAFEDQSRVVLLSPLAKAHLRARAVRRWTLALAMAALCLLAVAVMHWDVLRAAFADGSLYSSSLLSTDATFGQLVSAATTPWVFGAGAGIPAPPTPWLLVLMVASIFTVGHVGAALTMIFFLAAPLSALSFWALAGVFTRSDVVRVLGGLMWFSLGLSMGLYAEANLAMLTVMVFLPAAFAFVFRAVGMYHTEDMVKPRPSVQAAAISALCFMPVVAAEPQLLLPLILSFLAFFVFVPARRVRLLLIPVPSAFVVAPTLLNAIRYADEGAWRQIFGDIMEPSVARNGSPAALSLADVAQRALGWNIASWAPLDVMLTVVAAVVALLAVAALVLPFALRASRLMWVVTVTGAALCLVSTRVTIQVDADGSVAGSALPGMALAALGLFSCVCLVAGGAVKRFFALHTRDAQVELSRASRGSAVAIRVGRAVLSVVLAACVSVQCAFAVGHLDDATVGFSTTSLPMVAVDYLDSGSDHRVLALRAQDANSIDYTVMRTGRGDLIDSSPAQRVREISGASDQASQTLAQACASLLADIDADAIEQISGLGIGGIFVVASDEDGRDAYDQLVSHLTASEGTQSLVSSETGTYYRLTLNDSALQNIDTSWQTRTQSSPWRLAWLICLGVVVALYCLVALPRSRRIRLEEEA